MPLNRELKKRKSLAVKYGLKKSWATKSETSAVSLFLSRKGRILENLFICHISERYISFLHSRDFRVPFNKGQRRPYVGVVLTVGRFRYFVPMESPKPNHANLKPGKHILKLDGGRLGLLGFNNMVPVPDSAILEYDISAEPDVKYRNLLLNQIEHCNRQKLAILDHANRTYYDVVNGKSSFICKISCDFRALERACRSYNPNYRPKANS